jgi:hypothetical protein
VERLGHEGGAIVVGAGNVVIHHLCVASIKVRLGDSGGPIFYGNKAIGVTSVVNGTHHVDSNGVEWWDSLMFNEVRYEEQDIGLTVYIG